MMINPLVRIVTLLVIAAFSHFTKATAQDPVIVPDFTKGAKIPMDSRHDWNLGPTGLRGWIFCDRLVTTDARQILITKVDKGSPAADTFRVGDVILGVGGKLFSYDPRTELGRAITAAETKAGDGKLALTRWRSGKSEEVMLNLRVLGSYGATAPFDCDKSKLLLDQGCKALATRMSDSRYDNMDPIPRSLNALALLASGNPEYLPLVKREAQWAAQYSARSMQTWYYGYCLLFLSEYALATGDQSVQPGLRRLTLEAAKGQSAVGSCGRYSASNQELGIALSVYFPAELRRRVRAHFLQRCAYCQSSEALTVGRWPEVRRMRRVQWNSCQSIACRVAGEQKSQPLTSQ